MSDTTEPVAFDMYGQPIHRLGDKGFGISIILGTQGGTQPTPYIGVSVFHESDEFHQSLFSCSIGKDVHIENVFHERLAELFKVGTNS